MASALTKAALRNLEAGRVVAAGGRTHQARVAEKLTAIYQPVVREGETMPDWAYILELDSRLVDLRGDDVIQSDQAHRDQLVVVKVARENRDDRARAVADRIRGGRKTVGGAHGDIHRKLVGLEEPPQTKPLALYRQGEHILARFRDPELSIPAPHPGSAAVDPIATADGIEPDVKALGDALQVVDLEVKAADESKVARDHALNLQRRAYVNVARNQEAYYRMVGEDELADRIRPTLRRATRRVVEEEDEAQDGDEPSESPPSSTPPPPQP